MKQASYKFSDASVLVITERVGGTDAVVFGDMGCIAEGFGNYCSTFEEYCTRAEKLGGILEPTVAQSF